jgi:prophage regulatory protein
MTLQLMGTHELAELLGVSRQRADQLAREVGFPKPAAELKAGRIWKRSEVKRWHQNRQSTTHAR